MTSEVRDGKQVEAQALDPEPQTCLCCLHFAMDFDSMPDAFKSKRPSRQPKRRLESTESS
jgi:hypothetical protein